MPRPTPFDLVFEQIARDTFPAIRAALERSGVDPVDRDAFLMEREVVGVIRDLRPDEGVGEGIDQLAALVHHAYLLWQAGVPVLEIAPERTEALLTEPPTSPETSGAPEPSASLPGETSAEVPPAYYAQLPPRRIWAQPVPDEAHEPLDGCFVHQAGDDLRVLGIFGLHPERMGFTAVEAAGARPVGLRRPDGSPLFAPTLPGGAAAGLHSLAGAEELLELGWRTRDLASEVAVG